MRVGAKQYAETLYELTENKSEKEVSVIVSNFVKYLAKNNNLKLEAQVIEKFNNIWNEKHGIVEAEITTSRKPESHQVHQVENYIKEKYKAKKVVLDNKINKSIKGGIVIKVGDDILDASIAGKLIKLKNTLIH